MKRVELHIFNQDEPLHVTTALPEMADRDAQLTHLRGALVQRHGRMAETLHLTGFVVLGDA